MEFIVLPTIQYIIWKYLLENRTMKIKPISPKHKIQLETLGLFIKNLRLLEENLSQLELSLQLNLHHNTIQRIEKGANTTLITIFEISDFLGVKPSELMSIFE